MKVVIMKDVKEKSPLELYQEKVANGEIERIEGKTPKQKWEEDKKSLRKSINYFCVQCMGGCSGATTEIRNCTSHNCPLYLVRPYK